jgi:hypothetical protein
MKKNKNNKPLDRIYDFTATSWRKIKARYKKFKAMVFDRSNALQIESFDFDLPFLDKHKPGAFI